MPNHFHFLTYATDYSVAIQQLGAINIQNLSNAYRLTLSKYAQDINFNKLSSGSLFRQKTKAKEIIGGPSESIFGYAELCFNYIHRNPVDAALCKNMDEWEFSSYQDYIGKRSGSLCNRELTASLMGWRNGHIDGKGILPDIDDTIKGRFYE